jgi:heme exporter protein B
MRGSPVRRWWREAAAVARKDLAIERATGEVVTTTGFFAVLLAVLASLSTHGGPEAVEWVAPGVVWLSVTFAAVLGLGRVWHREREESAMVALILSPAARSAIFAGKALAIAAFVVAIELLVVPLAALLLGFDLSKFGVGLAVFGGLATIGIAATGTLFGALTVRTRARDLVLASVLLPLLAPTLGCAVAATRELFGGTSLAELGDYVELMGVFDLVFTAGGLALFGWVLE